MRSERACRTGGAALRSARWRIAAIACATGAPAFPWGNPAGPRESGTRSDVETVNEGYRRTTSLVLVRRIRRPTRASLDFAAYHANFMNADPAPEQLGSGGRRPDASHPFGGAIDRDTLTGSIARTPLSAEERAHPLALAPLVELLASKHVRRAPIAWKT